MRSKLILMLLFGGIAPVCAVRSQDADSLRKEKIYPIGKVVVTGTRHETDIRHLPMTISVVDRQKIEEGFQPSLLPTLTEQVPGLFVTGRGLMGYGVSGGAAGQMTLRGIGGTATGGPTTGLLVLIDGHPQYMGLMGHPIADAYQSMLADRVEVVRGPASVLYGSNAMGGVINIVTRKMAEDGVKTNVHAGYGSYNTLETEATNQLKYGRFTSTVTGSYNRTDGHRKDMGFEQYGGYAKLGYQITDEWDVYADVNLTHFNAQNPGAVSAPILDNKQHITRGMTSFALRNDYGKTSGALSFFYNWGRHKINDGYSPGAEPLDYRFNSRDRMLGVSWYQSASLFTGNRLTVGVDYQHFGGKAWNRYLNGDPDKTTADKTMDEVAGYVDFRQSLTHWLTLDAGLRLDHHSHAGTEWIPQGGLSFLLPRNAQIPLSDHPRDVHVPAAESGPEARETDELRTFVHAAAPRRRPLLRSQRLLHRRRQHDPDPPGQRPSDERQYGPGRELGRGRRRRLADLCRVVRFGQLQLSAHGLSGRRRSRTQTLRRGRLHTRPVERLDGHSVRARALYAGETQRTDRQFRAVECQRDLPRDPLARPVRPRREPAGATL